MKYYTIFSTDDDGKMEEWMDKRHTEGYQFVSAFTGGADNMYTSVIMRRTEPKDDEK